MALDATGAPTSPDNIPTYNTSVDAPSGNGFNAAMAQLQAIITQLKAGTLASGKIAIAGLAGYPADATKVLKGDGSWAALTNGATVATTIAGLGAGVDGKIGLLRLGATPYEIVKVTYDATYGKWVSDVCESDVIGAFPPRNAVSDAYFSQVAPAGSAFLFGSLTQPGFALRAAAGLTMQVRQVSVHQMSAVGTVNYSLRTWHATNNGNGAGDGVEFNNPSFASPNLTSTGLGYIGWDSGWQAIVMPGTPKDIFHMVSEFINSSAVSQTMLFKDLKLMVRWVA